MLLSNVIVVVQAPPKYFKTYIWLSYSHDFGLHATKNKQLVGRSHTPSFKHHKCGNDNKVVHGCLIFNFQ